MNRNVATNGQTIVIGNNSAVVDDFELIDRMAYERKSRPSWMTFAIRFGGASMN